MEFFRKSFLEWGGFHTVIFTLCCLKLEFALLIYTEIAIIGTSHRKTFGWKKNPYLFMLPNSLNSLRTRNTSKISRVLNSFCAAQKICKEHKYRLFTMEATHTETSIYFTFIFGFIFVMFLLTIDVCNVYIN